MLHFPATDAHLQSDHAYKAWASTQITNQRLQKHISQGKSQAACGSKLCGDDMVVKKKADIGLFRSRIQQMESEDHALLNFGTTHILMSMTKLPSSVDAQLIEAQLAS